MQKHPHARSTFSGKIGFVLSAAGASVGLGNIWRFPYLAAKYGGGIFLLIYILLALTFGYTMIVAETSIGRMTGKSPVGAFQSFGRSRWLSAGGWLNAVSSDHCGFDWKEQKHMGYGDFRNIPNGAPGLQNRLEVLWTYGVETGKITRQKLVDVYASTPAKNNGMFPRKGSLSVGADADIVVFDPNYKGTFTVADMLHDVDYCSYEGMEKIGRVDQVLLRGKQVVKDAKYIGSNGDGKLIQGQPFGLLYQQK